MRPRHGYMGWRPMRSFGGWREGRTGAGDLEAGALPRPQTPGVGRVHPAGSLWKARGTRLVFRPKLCSYSLSLWK